MLEYREEVPRNGTSGLKNVGQRGGKAQLLTQDSSDFEPGFHCSTLWNVGQDFNLSEPQFLYFHKGDSIFQVSRYAEPLKM